jgi:cystathionine beta-lyase/cystathionine gamma-synthase
MMSHGYKPELSQGAVKCPIFLTSTFVFASAEEGKDFFELAYGHRQSRPNEELGLIYSRINNPNLEILEDHVDIPAPSKIKMNITEKLIRLSIGVEDPLDLISDIQQAFEG